MFKYFFSFITILLTVNGFGQSSITIQGKIVEKGSSFPLESATVYLKSVKDSTVIDYTISDKSGNFSIKTKKIN